MASILPAPDEYPVPVEEVPVSEPSRSDTDPEVEVVTVTPDEIDEDTRDTLPSGMEAALRAAAEEARIAGWGRSAIVEDGAGDTVEALRKLRDGQKMEPES